MANVASAVRSIIRNEGHHEGRVTRVIEHQTGKIPSVVFLNLAFASMAGSLYIAAKKKKTGWANFVGLWAPSFMLMGIYNKLIKR